MSKGIKIDRKTNRLITPERGKEGTEASIFALLRADGWEVIPTKAEHVKRSKKGVFSAYKKGTLDGWAVRSWPRGNVEAGAQCDAFAMELKADRARTGKKHLAEQTAEVERLRRDGFAVYQAPEGHPDVVGHFKAWLREEFG